MNKTEFVRRIAEKNGVTITSARDAVDMILAEITSVMLDRESVYFQELGTFGVEFKPEHAGRNPATGEAITIPDKYVPMFKFGRPIKDAVK